MRRARSLAPAGSKSSAEAPVPAVHAVACVGIDAPGGPVDVVGVHIPTIGGRDALLKVGTQEGLVERLAVLVRPTVVCGDFNSPRAESSDGVVTPFAMQ